MTEGTFGNPQIVEEDVDILIIGGDMAACGTAFEIGCWNESAGLKIKLVDKAALDRPGAVAQGLSAIDTYCAPRRTRSLPTCRKAGTGVTAP